MILIGPDIVENKMLGFGNFFDSCLSVLMSFDFVIAPFPSQTNFTQGIGEQIDEIFEAENNE